MTWWQLEEEVSRLGMVQRRLIAEASEVRRHRDVFERRWIEAESKLRSAPAASGCACTCFSCVLFRWRLAQLQMLRMFLPILSTSSFRVSRKSLQWFPFSVSCFGVELQWPQALVVGQPEPDRDATLEVSVAPAVVVAQQEPDGEAAVEVSESHCESVRCSAQCCCLFEVYCLPAFVLTWCSYEVVFCEDEASREIGSPEWVELDDLSARVLVLSSAEFKSVL